jgi:phosphatidylinositol-3-phosphatase
MVLRRATLLALLLSGLALLAAGVGRTPGQSPSTPVAAASTQGVPAFDHIFVIVMENHAYSEIIGDSVDAPYINQLAANYGLATNYVAVAHPSLPNYFALTGGDTFGVTTDCTTCFGNPPNLVADRVAPSGRTWRAYQENMPSACFTGDSYPYAQKHNPFVYFNDIRTTAQCGNVVPMTGLASDLAATTTTPAYGWITPNLCDDMHDCPIASGDTWLSKTVPLILGSPAFTNQNSLLFITWDEDDSSQSNHVPTLVISRSVGTGFRSEAAYDHYSLLRTIEDAWGLAPLTAHDGAAHAMSDFFATPGTTVRVNTGGAVYVGGDGRAWQTDGGFSGGSTASVNAPISGTTDSSLYDSERYGLNFTYTFNEPAGNYLVTLKFAEIYWTAPGQRVFNVAINGQPVLTRFDILANVPRNTAVDRTFPTAVTSGTLSIAFTTIADNAKISAIEIVPTSSSTVRVNAGGAAYVGGDGRAWQADSGYSAGRTYVSTAPIGGTSDGALYDSERYGTLTYTFAVVNGTYLVTLKFAELYWSAPGQRVFNVSINGQQVLTNFDILANVARNTAIDRSFTTSVTGGTLSIAFITVVDNAKIDAIEVVPAH